MSAAMGPSDDELNEHLDDLIGPAEPDPDDSEEEPEPLAAEAEAEPEPEPEPEEESARRPDEEAPDDGASDGAEQEASAPSDDAPAPLVEDDADAKLAAAQKRAEGLQKEVAKLRQERRAREAERQQMQAPSPVREATETPVAKGPDGLPVHVSEDGTSVYVDRSGVTETAEEAARRVFEQMSKPTPEQVRAQEESRMMQEFVAEDTERNQPIYEESRQADEFIALSVQRALDQANVSIPPDMPLTQRIALAQQIVESEGVAEQVAEYFPHIAPVLREFIAASASTADNPMWKRSVLERIALSSGPAAEGETPRPASRVQSIAGAPKSMARKGGTRSVSPSSDESEFEKLESEFRADPAFMPEDSYKRYMTLGKKLGRTGLE